MTTNKLNVSPECLRQQLSSILAAWGLDADLVPTTVEAILYADLAGIDSHGISLLMTYEDYWTKGKVDFRARPEIVRQNAVMAVVDARAGLGHPAGVMAMELAISKAQSVGIGAVSVFNSHHFGAAGYYAALALRNGMIGFVTTTTRAVNVVPTRSSIPVLGTNPIAFAAPARRNRSFLLDMATATVAGNKVKIYYLNGKPLPEGWVQDEHGKPLRDAAVAWENVTSRALGGLTPVGGTEEMSSYKGYGLSVMVQILSATLSGGSFSPVRKRTQAKSDPDNIGHFFMVIDPKAFRPDGGFEEDLDVLIDELHGAKPGDPELPVLVAGDPEALHREERLRDGIPVPVTLAAKIRGICERCGVPFLLE